MDLIQAITLAFVQGITEFLPISSSAHLVITSRIMGWQDQGIAFDLGIHLGTLAAVMGYFWRDLYAYLGVFRHWHKHPRWHEVVLLAIASMPAAILGILFAGWVEENLRNLTVILAANTFFALLLWYADRHSKLRSSNSSNRGIEKMPWSAALIIGCAQAVAFVPGTSRSGITLTACMLLGMGRKAAASLSFLLSIPIILGGSLLTFGDIANTADSLDTGLLLLAIGITFIVALGCIGLFMRLITTWSLHVFVVYRLLLSGLLAYLLFFHFPL